MEIAKTVEYNEVPEKFEIVDILREVNVSAFCDKWGPVQVLHIYRPEIKLHGILVIDNITLGPAYGGTRISPTITPYKLFSRARTMTWTCALAGIKFGGAAAGIRAEPYAVDKTNTIRSFASEISPLVPDQYIAGPDENVGEGEMAAFVAEIGDWRGAKGKPESMGGIPYEMGVIGLGMGVAIETLVEEFYSSLGLPTNIPETDICFQGFDFDNATLAKYLFNKGANIVGISDEWGAVHDAKGLDLNKIIDHHSATTKKQSLSTCKGVKKVEKDEILKADCDILVSNSRDAMREEMTGTIKAKCVVEGGKGSVSHLCELLLHERGVLVLPDILTTSGGAIASYAEYRQEKCDVAFSQIESTVRNLTKEVIHQSLNSNIPPRRVAEEIAKERILQAMEAEK